MENIKLTIEMAIPEHLTLNDLLIILASADYKELGIGFDTGECDSYPIASLMVAELPS